MKRLLALLLCAVLLLALPGCKGKKDMAFTAVLPGNVSSLDPQTATGRSAQIAIGSLFEGLCRIDEKGEAAPGVASRWEANEDCTRFTFHLRKARWSDGSPVTAADFVFGALRALEHNEEGTPPDDLFLLKNARAIYAGEASQDQLGLWAEDDRTLVAQLEQSCPDFPAFTAGNHYMPCSQAYFEGCAGHYGLSAGYLLTNGPFTFPHEYAWDTDYNERSLNLVRSEEYRGDRKVVPSQLTYLIDYDGAIDRDPLGSLEGGLADILPVSDALAAEAEERGLETLALEDGVFGLLLNPQCDALSYVRTRELLIKTLDRRDLLERIGGVEAAGIMAPCVRWDGESYYAPGQTQYAKQDDEIVEIIPSLLELLELEKVPSITVLCPDDPVSIDLANGLLVAWNAKLGNAFNIQPLPEDELESRVAFGEYEAALYDLRAGGTSPRSVLKNFESGASPLLLRDEAYDSAFYGLPFDLNSYRELEQELQERYVFYPLTVSQSHYALAPGVTEVTVSPDCRMDFSQARKG